MRMLRSLIGFFRNLVRGPQAPQGQVEDTPEMEIEVERARGMRGD